MRCFYALPLPNEIKSALSSIVDAGRSVCSGLKWVPPENIHITLHFLGNIQDELVSVCREVLSHPLLERPSFKLSYDGFGRFPPSGRARVLFLNIIEGRDECSVVYQTLGDLLHPFMDLDTRTYKPHLTLARMKKQRNTVLDLSGLGEPKGAFTVDRVSLIESILKPHRAEYREIAFRKFK